MALAAGIVEAPDVSEAWLRAARALAAMPGRTAAHLVVRIQDPLRDDRYVRSELDRVLTAKGWQSTGTVANTLFPAALADRYPEPADLAEHYRSQVLPRLRRLARPKNARGTYFGRLVDYPGAAGESADQLTSTVAKLRRERSLPGPLSSCYEMAVQAPGEDLSVPPDPEGGGEGEGVGAAALTYHGDRDSSARMGFPCLSLVSFHLDGPVLHLAAHYRNQHFVERAYGNYLGLGRLLGYVAGAAGLAPGELLVVAGHARLECISPIRGLLAGHDPLPLEPEGPR
jgi:hypothetical protein